MNKTSWENVDFILFYIKLMLLWEIYNYENKELNFEVKEEIWQTLLLCENTRWVKVLCLKQYPAHQVAYNVVSVQKIDNYQEDWKEFFKVVDENYKWDRSEYVLEIDLELQTDEKPKTSLNHITWKLEEEKITIAYYKKHSKEGIYFCYTEWTNISSSLSLYENLSKEEQKKIKKLLWTTLKDQLFKLFT